MPDYDFYVNTYLGSLLQEKVFPQLAAKAAGILEGYGRYCRITGGETARKMAICAMAECLQEQERCHTAATLGKVSVRYEKPRLSLDRALYQAARIYLDIYRGVQ